MKKKITVLIVEDQELNRALLEEILKDECEVIQASNGEEGLAIVKSRMDIAVIILDLIMPVMDGFDFMKRISEIPEKCSIPIIVATEYGAVENEQKALSYGAYDFVSKPYDPMVVQLRVRNAAQHSRLVALEALHYIEEYDSLTGVYNKSSFIRATREMLNEASEDTKHAIIRFDATRFSLINSYYGLEEGDKLLQFLANVLRDIATEREYMTYGRLGSDDFAFCIEYDNTQDIYDVTHQINERVSQYQISFNIILIYGVYLIVDRANEIESMIANANMAAKGVKGNYINTVGIYDEKLSETRAREQEIVNEMKNALETEQFLVYLQPKYNSTTSMPCGAEALIRWKHPTKGMISPGVFIPVFESNGFVEPIDHYMWEHVCMLLHKWIKEGISPHPISVNVSRVNLYNPRIVEEISALCEKYEVPRHLLQLEITESAYTDNADTILGVINKFHDNGFTILMDDFGSGYSSLNVLKDMHVDVLKIDMKFFGKTDNLSRAETIISAVVRMAKWLDIATVAEGVETREQVDFLKSIGCTVIQGYYYAKPMPVDEYEELIDANSKYVNYDYLVNTDAIEWINSVEIDEIFANSIDPTCIMEVNGDEVEVLRVNQSYYDLLGYENSIMFVKHPAERALDEYKSALNDVCINCARLQQNQDFSYLRYTARGDIIRVHIELRPLKSFKDRSLIIGYLNKEDDQIDNDDKEEVQIRNLIAKCLDKSSDLDFLKKSMIPSNPLMEGQVDDVLKSKYMDKHALILISIDNLEEIKSTVSGQKQEIMWRSMEHVLSLYFRNNDIVSQNDNHEYSIFMTSVPSKEIVSVKCHELNRRIKIFSNISKFPVKVSIGVAVSSKDVKSYEDMYMMANEALDISRKQGHNRVYMVTDKT